MHSKLLQVTGLASLDVDKISAQTLSTYKLAKPRNSQQNDNLDTPITSLIFPSNLIDYFNLPKALFLYNSAA